MHVLCAIVTPSYSSALPFDSTGDDAHRRGRNASPGLLWRSWSAISPSTRCGMPLHLPVESSQGVDPVGFVIWLESCYSAATGRSLSMTNVPLILGALGLLCASGFGAEA